MARQNQDVYAEQPEVTLNFKELYQNQRFLRFARNETLFREDEDADGLYYLNSGKVKLVKSGPAQKLYIIEFMKPGDLLGLSGFINEHYTHSAVAMEPTSAYFIPRDDLLQIFEYNSTMYLRLMKSMCQLLEELEWRITGLSHKSTRERVALMLMALLSKYGTDQNGYLDISLSRKELANFAGTTSETLSRIVHDFQNNNLIVLNKRKIRLLNHERLQQIARREGL